MDISLQTFIDALAAHPYAFLFVGLLFAGETVLLPAVYFAFTGRLSLPYVIAVSIVATTIADAFWYFVGLHAKERFWDRVIEGRIKKTVEAISGAFAKRGARLLYISKFVYGVRIAAQVLAGAEKMPFKKYVTVNVLGVASLIGLIALIAYSVEGSLRRLGDFVHAAEIAFAAFAAILVLAHLAFGLYFKKKWFQR